MEPSSRIAADTGRRRTLSSRCTEIFGERVSSTYIRDEDKASVQWPLGENEKSKASPPGNDAEELVVVDVNVTAVCRGRRYASNRFLLSSLLNCFLNLSKLLSVKGPAITLLLIEKEGHLES